MQLLRLTLKDIGPFREVDLSFGNEEREACPVTFITGRNGTGKTILLDAIRVLFGQMYGTIERDIRRGNGPSVIGGELYHQEESRYFEATSERPSNSYPLGSNFFVPSDRLRAEQDSWLRSAWQQTLPNDAGPWSWVVDYWRSNLATDRFEIPSFKPPDHANYLKNSLSGNYENANLTNILCYFDYIRDSRDQREKKLGEAVYKLAGEIIELSLLDGGTLSHINRTSFMPVIRQCGHPLANISSGNAYLMQHMISMLGKMLSVVVLGELPANELGKATGLLLIDEAENHLHPSWQRRLIPSVRKVFPNLQIIATTHSPYVIASATDAKVFVCRYQAGDDAAHVVEATDSYANQPVDEILASVVFDETQPFNEQLSDLLTARKVAIETGESTERTRIEAQLQSLNPDAFAYFDIQARLGELYGEAS